MSELYPFESRWFDLDGLKMHYVDEGSGPPVVMVHGNPTWSFYWRNLIVALRPEHRCIALDHIGMGRSDKPTDERYEYTLSRRIADLGRLLDHLELTRVDLVAHDWGGAIAMGWATAHPDRVRRLVVMNTAAFGLPPGKRFPPSLTLARTPGLGATLVRGANAFIHGANRLCVTRRRMSPEVARGYLEPYSSWSDRIAIHRFIQDIPLHPRDPAFAPLTAIEHGLHRLADKPLLLCWGMRDFVFDHHFLQGWINRLPHAQVRRFEDCGHYVLEDAPEEIAAEVGRFLDEQLQPEARS